ncbi:MAG: transcriptional regulator, partial [bacterium]|nr:transcriptional regulator [bacterium]
DEKKQGKYLFGFTVAAPQTIADMQPDVILISSMTFEKEIYRELQKYEEQGIKIVRLYN